MLFRKSISDFAIVFVSPSLLREVYLVDPVPLLPLCLPECPVSLPDNHQPLSVVDAEGDVGEHHTAVVVAKGKGR